MFKLKTKDTWYSLYSRCLKSILCFEKCLTSSQVVLTAEDPPGCDSQCNLTLSLFATSRCMFFLVLSGSGSPWRPWHVNISYNGSETVGPQCYLQRWTKVILMNIYITKRFSSLQSAYPNRRTLPLIAAVVQSKKQAAFGIQQIWIWT